MGTPLIQPHIPTASIKTSYSILFHLISSSSQHVIPVHIPSPPPPSKLKPKLTLHTPHSRSTSSQQTHDPSKAHVLLSTYAPLRTYPVLKTSNDEEDEGHTSRIHSAWTPCDPVLKDASFILIPSTQGHVSPHSAKTSIKAASRFVASYNKCFNTLLRARDHNETTYEFDCSTPEGYTAVDEACREEHASLQRKAAEQAYDEMPSGTQNLFTYQQVPFQDFLKHDLKNTHQEVSTKDFSDVLTDEQYHDKLARNFHSYRACRRLTDLGDKYPWALFTTGIKEPTDLVQSNITGRWVPVDPQFDVLGAAGNLDASAKRQVANALDVLTKEINGKPRTENGSSNAFSSGLSSKSSFADYHDFNHVSEHLVYLDCLKYAKDISDVVEVDGLPVHCEWVTPETLFPSKRSDAPRSYRLGNHRGYEEAMKDKLAKANKR
ncbi:hypothetical protein L198_03185 [Cryptococcus wingfieldii CBS 7118]|uniref:Uncharacterized protein n=1 Tax=Cryptococcus wingfieldii CBS 7118 TaxID=1295528 RepID=A0A1E3JEN7_9TREE|nr:hypothetical protein L198_03185 [Cryptococcus wingfieldii CBS 7118]ODN99343.1 hypothetical protein L198_03185 [Cryptococcus wingfieldii CBS 7118]